MKVSKLPDYFHLSACIVRIYSEWINWNLNELTAIKCRHHSIYLFLLITVITILRILAIFMGKYTGRLISLNDIYMTCLLLITAFHEKTVCLTQASSLTSPMANIYLFSGCGLAFAFLTAPSALIQWTITALLATHSLERSDPDLKPL